MKELDYLSTFQCVLYSPLTPVKFYAELQYIKRIDSSWATQRQRSGSGLHENWALPGNTVGSPREILSGPLALPEYPILQGKSSFMWATPHTCPRKVRGRKIRANTPARPSKYRQEKSSITEPPGLPQGMQSFPSWKEAPEGSWGKLWLTAQWSDSDIPESTHAYESAEPKDK